MERLLVMDHFSYRDGALHVEEVPVNAIAAAVGTPFFCYSSATLKRHYQVLDQALSSLEHTIFYAVKANGNLGVIATLASEGAGADVVSGGELTRVLAAGVPASKVVFSGVGKTPGEMARALGADIFQLNVESEPELEALSEVAVRLGKRAPVAIRVNPDIDARTHEKITTGRSENKFGIDWTRTKEIYARARELPGLDPVGIAVHIGSQLTDLEPFRRAYTRVRELVETLRAEGHAIGRIDLGGGLGIPYHTPGEMTPPSPAEYGEMVVDVMRGLENCHFAVEPGRMIAGNAGIFVSRVIFMKTGEARTFAIIDGAMNDLIRPTLYEAYHAVETVRQPAPGIRPQTVDVVGPVCETGDYIAQQRELPPLAPGDLIAVRSCGAYGAVMSSTYNARALAPEVLVDGDRYEIVRSAIGVEEMMRHEKLPAWLNGGETARSTGT